MKQLFAAIPGVDKCKQSLLAQDPSLQNMSSELLRILITQYWDNYRQKIKSGQITSITELELQHHLPNLLRFVQKGQKPRFKKVLNATGIVIHTNMGRSVLSHAAQQAVQLAAANYSNLELDLSTGLRGSRYALVEHLLAQVTGAEAGLVVNNNAAAVLLLLDTFCAGSEVSVSRGELVEIGGSFRIPAVMSKTGAILREVGTTNRTHLEDYAAAITPQTKALMRVHTSNYRIIGFHSRVPLEDLAKLAAERGLLLLEDLGSGSLVHFDINGLDEPTVQETVRYADVVTFSGDKVLGGPQAGLLVGKAALIQKLKANQLTRALRCDKLCLAALEATLRCYLDQQGAKAEVPTLAGITVKPWDLAGQSSRLARGFTQALEGKCEVSVRDAVPGWRWCFSPGRFANLFSVFTTN